MLLITIIITPCTGTNIFSDLRNHVQARHLGPATGGRISAIEGINTELINLYIGTAGGGVWKTTNAGASFSSVFDKPFANPLVR